MRLTGKIEVISGSATALSAIIIAIIVRCPVFANDVGGIGIHIGLALLVATGSYVHAAQRKTAGLVMLLVGGILEIALLAVFALGGGLLLFCGIREGMMILTPSVPAIIAIIASLVTRRHPNSERAS